MSRSSSLWTVLLLSSLSPRPSSLCAETSPKAQAEIAWEHRDQPGQTEAAIQDWTQALQAEPKRADLWIDLAKAQGRAVRHAETSQDRRKWADAARHSACQAVRLAPHDAEAYTVYGEAMGQWANAHKGFYSLSAVRRAIYALQKAISIDPRHAYAHMLLAEFYRQAPRFLSVGDKKKALRHAQLAVQYGPNYAINHLVLARAYFELQRKNDGIAELQRIVALSPPTDNIPETMADQDTAKKMLASLGVVPVVADCGQAGPCSEQRP